MPIPTTHNPAQPGSGETNSGTASGTGDEKLLERIRTRFTYMTKRWKNIRDAAEEDMRAQYAPKGPWLKEEITARGVQKRPCVHLDQLKQYPRSLVNQVRQNPQGVKVTPGGNGANDKTATLRGDRIRSIEMECNASQAYLTALQCAAERGYGVLTMETEEIAWDGWDQRIKIVREPDPDAILWDPDAKEADSSDMEDGFKLWQMPIADFRRKYPGEEETDFNLEQIIAPEWINVERQTLQMARYSYIEKTERYVYLIDDGTPKGMKIFKDELPKDAKAVNGRMIVGGASYKILKEKKAIEKHVKQCVTNGVKIFDKTDWAGKWIPIFPMLGAEAYTRIDGQIERILESYIRPAIDGQRAFDSAASNQTESANMVPKITYLMYEGQASQSTDWENINKVATPYAEIVAIPDGAGGVLPLPQRVPYEPPIQQMEILKESNRRAIQAAIGSHGFTINDDTNVKSGKAVNALKQQSDVGSFHFIDSYQTTLRHVGRAMDDLLDKIEDTPRDVGLRKQNGKSEMVRINEPYQDPNGEMQERRYTPRDPETEELMSDAAHTVEIDTGPWGQSKRDEAREFLTALLNSPMGPLVADLLAQAEDLGPFTDEIVERLTPPQFQKQEGMENIPPQVKQQLQALGAQNKELTASVNQLLQEREAKTAELQSREQIAAADNVVKKLQIESNERIARMNANVKVGILDEQLRSSENTHQTDMAFEEQNAALAHDREMEAQELAASQTANQSTQDHGEAIDAQTQQNEASAAAQTQAEGAAAEAAATAVENQPAEDG